MKVKEMRLRVPENLATRFRIICLEKRLSVPKQTAALIRQFVEIQEENSLRMQKGH